MGAKFHINLCYLLGVKSSRSYKPSEIGLHFITLNLLLNWSNTSKATGHTGQYLGRISRSGDDAGYLPQRGQRLMECREVFKKDSKGWGEERTSAEV